MASTFADLSLISSRQSQDHLVDTRRLCSGHDRIVIDESHPGDVLGHSSAEQLHILRDISDERRQMRSVDEGNIGPIQANVACRGWARADDQPAQTGFAGRRRPYDPQSLTWRYHEANVAYDWPGH